MQAMFILSNHYTIIFQNFEVLFAPLTKLNVKGSTPMKYMQSSGTIPCILNPSTR